MTVRHGAELRDSSSTGNSGHILQLDGLRGAAALLVVISHFQTIGLSTSYVPHSGTFGVMIFFVLSGFLMGHLYLFRPFDRAAAVNFLSSRIARVLPLFYAVIIGSYLISQVMGDDFVYYLSAFEMTKHLLFIGSKYVFWSIPPEVEFYVIFVGLWYVVAKQHVVKFLPIFCFSLSAMFVLQPAFPGITVFHSLPIFLIGVAAAVMYRMIRMDMIDKLSVTVVQIAGVVLMLLIFCEVISTDPTKTGYHWERGEVYESIPMALLFGVLILSFTIDTWFARLVFANPIVRRIGAYSFSIYLLHEPVASVVRHHALAMGVPIVLQIILVIAAALGVSALSFHLFEMPMQSIVKTAILRMAQRWTGGGRPQQASAL